MVRFIMIFLLISTLSYSANFKKSCLDCHSKFAISIETFYMSYLLKYSSTARIKKAMFEYFRNPVKERSVMDKAIIEWLGMMPKIEVSKEDLEALIDTYIKGYDVRQKLH